MPTSVLGTVSVYVGSVVATSLAGGSLNVTSTVLVSAYICSVAPVSLAGGSLNVTSTVLVSAYIQSTTNIESTVTVLGSVYVQSTLAASVWMQSTAAVSAWVQSTLNVESTVTVLGSVYVQSTIAASVWMQSTALVSTYIQSTTNIESTVTVLGSVYVQSTLAASVWQQSTALVSAYIGSVVAVSLETPSASLYVTSVVSIHGSVIITDVEKTVSYYNSSITFGGAETSILVSPGGAEKVQVKYLCVVSDTNDVVVKIWEEDTNTHMCFHANMLDGSAINANLIGANWITTTNGKDVEINASKVANIWVVLGYVLV